MRTWVYRYRRLSRTASVLTAGLISIACSQKVYSSATATSTGFLVLGDEAARRFGGAAGDTVFEVSANQVALVVRDSAARWAIAQKKEPTCTRFFRSPPGHVALYAAFCGPDRAGKETDARLLRQFGRDGAPVGEELWWRTERDIKASKP
jgi:hypothetical protein